MGKPTTAKASAIEAEKIAVEYLKKQNRPYNSTDIFNNLKGAVSKTALLKALTDAVEKGLIFAKPYSKTNILYCPKQEIIENVDEVEQEVCSMIAEATNQLTELNEKVKTLKKEINQTIALGPPNQALFEELSRLIPTGYDLALSDQKTAPEKENIDTEEEKRVQESLKMASLSWTTRKKQCMNIVNEVTSASGEKPEIFMESAGLEGDP